MRDVETILITQPQLRSCVNYDAVLSEDLQTNSISQSLVVKIFDFNGLTGIGDHFSCPAACRHDAITTLCGSDNVNTGFDCVLAGFFGCCVVVRTLQSQ